MKMNPVVHFEMPAKNKERVKKFYGTVFGWKMVQLGSDMDNYVLANTAETDKKGMVKTKGAINGGFWETKEKAYPHVVISVENIEKSIEKDKKIWRKDTGRAFGTRYN